jgi:hypothetical protein
VKSRRSVWTFSHTHKVQTPTVLATRSAAVIVVFQSIFATT